MGKSKNWLKRIVNRRRGSHAETDTDKVSPNEKNSKWSLWKSHHVNDNGSKPVEDNSDKSGENAILVTSHGTDDVQINDAAREEQAAICIQTAFRAFLARRALRALKGLVRLQAAISGHGVRKQATGTLRCIQTFVRVQARVRTHRVLKSREAQCAPPKLPGQTVESQSTDSAADWDDSIGTVEETLAKIKLRQEAAIKRERAMAYAFSNQWRAHAKVTSETLFDYGLDNSSWSWIWLDRWISGRPGEFHALHYDSNQPAESVTSEEDGGQSRTTRKSALDTQTIQKSRASLDSSKTRLEEPDGNEKSSSTLNRRRSLSNPKQRPSKDVNKRHSLLNLVRKPANAQNSSSLHAAQSAASVTQSEQNIQQKASPKQDDQQLQT